MRNSEGSIERRGKNRFRARITVRGEAYSKSFKTAGEAEQWVFDLRMSTGDDDLLHRLVLEKLKVSELIERFRDEVAAKRATPEARRREVSRCNFLLAQPQLSNALAVQLQARHIVTFVVNRRLAGASDGSIRAELAIIRRVFNLAAGPWGYQLEQPVRPGLMPPPPPARERRLSADEYERLIRAAHAYENAVGGRDRIPIGIIIETAIQTAMRRGEMASLTWDRVEIFNDGFGIATLPQLRTKTRKARQIPLSPILVAMLLTLPSAATRQGLVFGTTSATIGTAWTRVCTAAGLHVSRKELKELRKNSPREDHGLRLHDLRHEGTSRFFEIYGMHKALVQSVTGHSSESMADRYTHLDSRQMLLRIMREHHEPNPIAEGIDVCGIHPDIAGSQVWQQLNTRAMTVAERLVSPEWKMLKRDAAALRLAIWKQPIESLADAMGVSDAAVHKACKKLGVEKPPRGYWLRSK